jgi:branched-chain amino acid transport system ATP-binding protein
MSSADAPLLQIDALNVRFGGVQALGDVTFSVEAGDFVGLIGPNGAGKTTVLNIVSRLYEPSSGTIRFDNVDLLSRPSHSVIDLGISRTFQNIALSPGMSVRRNVMLGGYHRVRCGSVAEWLQLPSARAAARTLSEQADRAIALVGLTSEADAVVGTLSHGTKRKVELARALCAEPKLLMLDEPASGLTDEESDELVDLLKDLRRRVDLTVIVIEHHLDVVLALSDRLVVLDMGRVIADGAPDEVTNEPAVIEAYIGGAR